MELQVLDTINLFFIFFIINKRIMDLFTIIIIIVFVFIIKYLIDTINSLNLEIREIKEKCISNNKNTSFKSTTNVPKINMNDIIKGITYFKNYVDEQKY
jgi:hypothetical protein